MVHVCVLASWMAPPCAPCGLLLPCRRPPPPRAAWTNHVDAQGATSLATWLNDHRFPRQEVELKAINEHEYGGFAMHDFEVGEIAIKIPEKYTISCVDVANHSAISRISTGRTDFVGLSLWLMYEKWIGKNSLWYPYVRTLSSMTLSPLTWKVEELEKLLKGTSVLGEITKRIGALQGEFEDILGLVHGELKEIPSGIFTFEGFKEAFSVITSRAVYLPSADILALVPFGDVLNFSGDCQASFEYSIEEQAIILRVDKSYKRNEQVYVSYGQNRSNADLVISCGFLDENNKMDFIEIEVGLIDGDPLWSLKCKILQEENFKELQRFPLYLDRFPIQLLSYMRLARLQDPALIAKISFDKDVIVDQLNEYEVLTLLLSECQKKLSAFEGDIDDEICLLKSRKLSIKEELAAKVRLCEKRIWEGTMGVLRKRLTAIRGVPTKSGLKDPNSDIKEMFDKVEKVLSAPRRFLSNILKSKVQ